MSLPLAVAPSTKTPGFYLTVNLLAGTANPGTARLRALLIAPPSAAGSAVVNQVYGLTGDSTADVGQDLIRADL